VRLDELPPRGPPEQEARDISHGRDVEALRHRVGEEEREHAHEHGSRALAREATVDVLEEPSIGRHGPGVALGQILVSLAAEHLERGHDGVVPKHVVERDGGPRPHAPDARSPEFFLDLGQPELLFRHVAEADDRGLGVVRPVAADVPARLSRLSKSLVGDHDACSLSV